VLKPRFAFAGRKEAECQRPAHLVRIPDVRIARREPVGILEVMSTRDIVVIGASAGGLQALPRLASTLPNEFQAAVFVTLHLYNGEDGFLPLLLNRTGPLPAAHARDGEPVKRGRIYVAPPDYHLGLEKGRVLLSHGPKENLQRPCINVMFRSAASAYGSRVVGVLLTGMLDDGAAGLWEIQRQGGATIVQDPEEAQFRSMPDSAIRGLNVQYIVPVAQIGPLLTQLAEEDGQRASASYTEARREPSSQSCPACGGAMTAAKFGSLYEFQCHLGHRFGLKSMIAEKREVVGSTIDSALAQSEELTALLQLSLAEQLEPEGLDELRAELSKRKNQQGTLRALVGTGRRVPVES
jgi:two-component system, chemotaxis family, protein-glutamate methylesterase/glutaminase